MGCKGYLTEVDGVQRPSMPSLNVGFYAQVDAPYKAYKCSDAQALCLGGTADSCGGGRSGLQCANCNIGQASGQGKPCVDCSGNINVVMLPLFLILGITGTMTIHKLNSGNRRSAFTQIGLISIGGQIFNQMQMLA